ncbi:hypothetical protein Tco_1447760 [Tanacetum coccineum]
MINMDALVRLRIYRRLGDVDTWVAIGPERQQFGATTRAAQIDPEGLERLEEEVHGLRESFGEQRLMVDAMSKYFSRFTTWVVGRLGQLLDASGVTYPRYFLHVSIQRILVYEYGVLTSCTVLGPSERKDEFGGMLIY